MINAWILAGTTTALRPMTAEDQPLFHAWLQNPTLRKMIDNASVPTENDQQRWFERSQQPDRALFSIVTLPNETLIGNGGLVDIEGSTAQLRITIGNPDAWNKGYGTEVVGMIVQYAFEQRGLQSLWLKVQQDNTRAIRVYKKNGFRIEGVDEKGLLRMRFDAPHLR